MKWKEDTSFFSCVRRHIWKKEGRNIWKKDMSMKCDEDIYFNVL
jgi:hypothetical protein